MSVPDNPFTIGTAPNGRKYLLYNNQEAHLAGIYAPTDKLEGNFSSMMDTLAAKRNNFFRHWMISYYLLDPANGNARQKYCPFYWTGGAWDLTRYNDDYFNRLRNMIAAAQSHGIIVQVTIFDGPGNRPGPNNATRWPWSPWNSHQQTDGHKNNINGVIDDPTTAFPKFYDMNQRAYDSTGFPITLGKIQEDYVWKVVTSTRDFNNVVYEIINEPQPVGSGDTSPARVKWADYMVGVIYRLTIGKRLIFYNDHTYSASAPHGGLDLNYWFDNRSTLTNYNSLQGVIFHGNPRAVDPDNRTEWKFRNDKVFQASSDAFNDATRNDKDWTRETTKTCFMRHVIYQAETLSQDAAEGIHQATPPPTLLHLTL